MNDSKFEELEKLNLIENRFLLLLLLVPGRKKDLFSFLVDGAQMLLLLLVV